MELILINDKKLKIMLTPGDMQDYDINCDTVNYDSTETRRAFWNILDEAKHATGFDAASERVYIQLYPSREGGCEMYVTKLGTLNEKADKTSAAPLKSLAYTFGSIGLLLRVCRQLESSGYKGTSAAFADKSNADGCCCLVLSGSEEELARLSFIGEFGEENDPDALKAYINEYCRCICEKDAVLKLSSLA